MDINVDYNDKVGLISIKGELDAISSPDLAKVFSDQIAQGYTKFVVDLKDLLYSSSAGIRIFLGSARDARQKGGDLRLAAVQPQVNKIFNLSRFDKVVKIFNTCDEAIHSYNE